VDAPVIDLGFPHRWQAEMLAARPLILPPRHYVYPREAEEVERGALEVLVRPAGVDKRHEIEVPAIPPFAQKTRKGWGTQPDAQDAQPDAQDAEPDAQDAEPNAHDAQPDAHDAQPFLATCALGFRDPVVPSGIWSAPHPDWLCAVSGGYAYLIDTTGPERFSMIPYRPVLEVRAVTDAGLLLFVGHQSVLAWGRDGQAWESGRVSDEGVTITGVEDGVLRGVGWEMRTDKETRFGLDLRTGRRVD
jgi:hypothetical protein